MTSPLFQETIITENLINTEPSILFIVCADEVPLHGGWWLIVCLSLNMEKMTKKFIPWRPQIKRTQIVLGSFIFSSLTHQSSPPSLYSFDSRAGASKPATHSAIAGDQGKRMFFALDAKSPKEAHLQINEVKAADGGVYRCRVDFFNSPTKNFRVNLSLVGE